MIKGRYVAGFAVVAAGLCGALYFSAPKADIKTTENLSGGGTKITNFYVGADNSCYEKVTNINEKRIAVSGQTLSLRDGPDGKEAFSYRQWSWRNGFTDRQFEGPPEPPNGGEDDYKVRFAAYQEYLRFKGACNQYKK